MHIGLKFSHRRRALVGRPREVIENLATQLGLTTDLLNQKRLNSVLASSSGLQPFEHSLDSLNSLLLMKASPLSLNDNLL